MVQSKDQVDTVDTLVKMVLSVKMVHQATLVIVVKMEPQRHLDIAVIQVQTVPSAPLVTVVIQGNKAFKVPKEYRDNKEHLVTRGKMA